MPSWWATRGAAWGGLITGVGIGGVLTYIAPQIGIPICIILTGIGISLLVRAYLRAEIRFEFNGDSMTTKDNRLILGVAYLTSKKTIVESLQLDYNNNLFCPSNGLPTPIEDMHTQAYTFDLKALQDIANETSQEAVFIIKAGKGQQRSKPFNIYKLL
ncbi:MAG TPA: hypothetical protein VF366_07295 [Dehalococcoidia bacterium]